MPTKDQLGLEVEAGVLIQAVIDTNPKFTMNDGNVKAGSIELTAGAGKATITGAGKYIGDVNVTFKYLVPTSKTVEAPVEKAPVTEVKAQAQRKATTKPTK